MSDADAFFREAVLPGLPESFLNEEVKAFRIPLKGEEGSAIAFVGKNGRLVMAARKKALKSHRTFAIIYNKDSEV